MEERAVANEQHTRNSVTAVIVNYNSGRLLERCLSSLITQVSEVIIVDNASTDQSFENCIRQYADDSGLHFVKNNKNTGFASACNTGLSHAKGNVILFLNPDCEVAEGAVDEMLQVLMSDPQVGMVGGLLLNPDGSEQPGGRRAVPTPWRSFVRAFGLYRLAHRWPKLFYDFYLHKQPLPKQPVEVEAVSGACMMVKHETVEDVGEWDEGYFLHCEDLDWCMRFRQKGWKILFVPTARVTHVKGACSESHPLFVEWHKHKGMIRFYRKFFRHQYPFGLMGLVTLGVWLRFIAVAAVKGLAGGRK